MVSGDVGMFIFPLKHKIVETVIAYHSAPDTFELHVGGTANTVTDVFYSPTYRGYGFITFRAAGLAETIGKGCAVKTRAGGGWIDFGLDTL